MVLKSPTVGDSTPVRVPRIRRLCESERVRTTADFKEVVVADAHYLFPPGRSSVGLRTFSYRAVHLFTTMAPSSMMQPEPTTIGPAMAKMVALGWTIVPGET